MARVKRVIFIARWLIVMIGCVLVSCSSSSTPASGNAQGVVTPDANLNGCFTPHIPIDRRPKADVILTAGAQHQSATAHVNQIVEVRLTAGVKWKLSQSDQMALLQPNTPFGWFDGEHLQCVWDFAVIAKGKVDLSFSGRLVCASGKPCPSLAVVADYTVTIS